MWAFRAQILQLLLAGILLLVYYSRALDPPAETVDPLQAHQAAYYNVKHGSSAICVVFLGDYLLIIPVVNYLGPLSLSRTLHTLCSICVCFYLVLLLSCSIALVRP